MPIIRKTLYTAILGTTGVTGLALFATRRSTIVAVVQPDRGWTGWVVDGLTSVFAGILPRRKGPNGEIEGPANGMFKRARKPRLGEHSTGEVVAELKKVRPILGGLRGARADAAAA